MSNRHERAAREAAEDRMATTNDKAAAKHTPGPWRYDMNETAILGPNGESVVSLLSAMGGEDTLADALLLAAAPDLLAALTDVTEALAWVPADADGPSPDYKEKILSAARAAIRKARGAS